MRISRTDALIVIGSTVLFAIAFSLGFYEFDYLNSPVVLLLVFAFALPICLLAKRTRLIASCALAGFVLSFLQSPTYPLINTARIAISDADDLPKPGEIVSWSKPPLFLTESFFYLMRARETGDDKTWNVPRYGKMPWLADDSCKTKLLSRLGDYRLIWSRCGWV